MNDPTEAAKVLFNARIDAYDEEISELRRKLVIATAARRRCLQALAERLGESRAASQITKGKKVLGKIETDIHGFWTATRFLPNRRMRKRHKIRTRSVAEAWVRNDG